MSSDSKLDLDDVAAGHPVAMYELKELRAQRDAAHNDARLLDGQIAEMREALAQVRHFLSMGGGYRIRPMDAILLEQINKLLPAPGVALPPLSKEERDARRPVHPAVAMNGIAGTAHEPGVAQEPEGHWDGTPCDGVTPTLAACPKCPRKPPEGKPSEREEGCACGAGHREGEECFPVEDKVPGPPDGITCKCGFYMAGPISASHHQGRCPLGRSLKPSPSPENEEPVCATPDCVLRGRPMPHEHFTFRAQREGG